MAEKIIPVCPICETSEKSFKVSEIYIQSLVRLKHGNNAEAPIIDALQMEIPEERRDKLKGAKYYRQLMESFAPPQGETRSTRAVNPDLVVGAVGLLSVFILYQVFSTQYFVFWYVLAFALIAFAAYFLSRKRIIAKFTAARAQEAGTKPIIEKAIGLWMKLYYCAQDNVVYWANKKDSVPIDQMNNYLLQKAGEKK